MSVLNCSKPCNTDITQPDQTRLGNPGQLYGQKEGTKRAMATAQLHMKHAIIPKRGHKREQACLKCGSVVAPLGEKARPLEKDKATGL